MRILHIDSGREMRGGQWQALYLMRGLRDLGHEVELLARRESPLFEAAAKEGISGRQLGWMPARGFDLIHAHDARSHTLGLLITGAPLVVSRRVAFPVRNNQASRFKYRRKAHFIAVSGFVEQTLRAAGVPADRITVVHDGVELPPAVEAERQGVLAVDLDDPLKGKALIQQAAKLAGIDVKFSRNLAEDLPGAAAFVYISESEGLGSAALMGMAAGTPVIASRVGGMPEVVEDEICGLLTENRPAAIAAAVTRLLNNPQLANQLAAEGRRRVEQRFTVQQMVDGTMQVYEKVLA